MPDTLDGNFETGDDGFYQYGAHLVFARDNSAGNAHGGIWSEKITRQNFTEWEGIANDNINMGFTPLVPGQVFTVNAWVKMGTASLSLIRLRCEATGGTTEEATTPVETVDSWNRFTVTHTVTGDSSFVVALYHDGTTGNNGETFWVDDFVVAVTEPSTETLKIPAFSRTSRGVGW